MGVVIPSKTGLFGEVASLGIVEALAFPNNDGVKGLVQDVCVCGS